MINTQREKLHNLVDHIPEIRLKEALRLVGTLLPVTPSRGDPAEEWLAALRQMDAEQEREEVTAAGT